MLAVKCYHFKMVVNALIFICMGERLEALARDTIQL